MPKCINKTTKQIAEYEKIECSLNDREIGNYRVEADWGVSHAEATLTPTEFYKFFKPLEDTNFLDFPEDEEPPKKLSEDKKLYKYIKRLIHYCVSFYNDVIPYREGTLEFETMALGEGQEICPDCKFVSTRLDLDLKDMVCQKYGKPKERLRELEIDKIDIIEKR